MALSKQVIDFPLGTGLDSGTDPKVFSAPRFSVLENATVSKITRSLQKRNGFNSIARDQYSVISGGVTVQTALPAAENVFTHSDELVARSSSFGLFGYSATANQWASVGYQTSWEPSLLSVVPRLTSTLTDQNTYHGNAVKLGNQVLLAVKSQDGSITHQVVDTSTGTRLLCPTGLGGAAFPSLPGLCVLNNKFQCYYGETAVLGVRRVEIDPNNVEGTIGAASTGGGATGYAISDQNFGFDSWSQGAVYAFRNTGGSLVVGLINADGTFGPSVTPVADASTVGARSPIAVAVSPDATRFMVLYFRGGGSLRGGVVMLDQHLATIASGDLDTVARNPRQVTCCWDLDGTRVVCAWEIDGFQIIGASRNSAGAAVDAPAVRLRHSQLCSTLFRVNGEMYFHTLLRSPIPGGTSIQKSVYLWRMSQPDATLLTPELCGWVLPNIALPPDTLGQQWLSKPLHIGNEVLFCGIRFSTNNDPQNEATAITYNLCPLAANTASFNNATHLSGMQLGHYTSFGSAARNTALIPTRTVNGFVVFPEGVTAAGAAGGGLTALGVYSYRVYYEKILGNRQRSQSTTAAVINITLAAGQNTVNLTIPSLAHRSHDEYVVVYRTLANGSVFYRHPVRVPNSTAADTLAFSDGTSDAAISVNEIDPYAAGELDNVALPATKSVWSALNRLWAIRAENPKIVLFSKLTDQDFAVEWNEVLQTEFPEDVNALGFLTNQVLAFADRSIYSITGQGPDNLGIGSFSPPFLVSSNLGCINPKTLVEMPLGHVFLSHKGFYLLTRNLETRFIGRPVAAYEGLSFTGAQDFTAENQVRFTSSQGTTLVWDYEQDLWSTWTGLAADDSTVWQNKQVLVAPNVEIKAEHAGWRDNGTPVLMRWETGWMKFGSLQNFGRLYRTYVSGEEKTGTLFSLQAGFDYKDEYSPSNTYSSQDLPTVELRTRKQKSNAFRFLFSELVPSGTGQGIEFTGLSFELGVRNTGFRGPVEEGA